MRNLKTMLISAVAATTALVLLTILAQSSVPAVSAQQGEGPSTVACITFTKDGKEIGERICNPAQTNDIHIAFRGECTVQFTVDGKKEGKPVECPRGANDFSAAWLPNREGFGFSWTRNGQDIGDAPSIPQGANDFHFKADKIVVFVWTWRGDRVGDPIPAPAGANDVEFDLVVLPR